MIHETIGYDRFNDNLLIGNKFVDAVYCHLVEKCNAQIIGKKTVRALIDNIPGLKLMMN